MLKARKGSLLLIRAMTNSAISEQFTGTAKSGLHTMKMTSAFYMWTETGTRPDIPMMNGEG